MTRRRPPRSPWLVLTAVFGAALAVRLVLALWIYPAQGFAADLRYFQTWATEMLAAGPGGIYGTDPQINYPPGYLDVLWGLAWVARETSQTFGAGYADTLAVLLKLPAIAADLAVGTLVYVLARRIQGHTAGVWAAALVLFIPVTWYDSAVWGQVDSISGFLMLGSLTLLVLRRDVASSAAAAAAVLVKPQAVIVMLVVGAVLVRRHAIRKQHPWVLLAAPAAAVSTLTLVAAPFDVGLFAPDRLKGVPVLNELGGLFGLSRRPPRASPS